MIETVNLLQSFDSLLVYENKYYLEIYLDNCAYKIANKQMSDHLDDNLLKIRYHECYISEGIDVAN